MSQSQLKIKTTSNSITIAESVMFATSSLALFLAWGMMAIMIDTQAVSAAGEDQSPKILWEYTPTQGDIVSAQGVTLADFFHAQGYEAMCGLNVTSDTGEKNLVFLSSKGERLFESYPNKKANITTPTVVDWNGDGENELVFINLDQAELVVADRRGNVLLSHQFTQNPQSVSFVGLPAVADLNNDGIKDFVVTQINNDKVLENKDVVHAVNGKDGTILWDYVIGTKHKSDKFGCTSAPVIADVLKRGSYDVFFNSCDCLDSEEANGYENPAGNPDIGGFPLQSVCVACLQPNQFIKDDAAKIIIADGHELCGTATFWVTNDGALYGRKFINDKKNEVQFHPDQISIGDLLNGTRFWGSDNHLELAVTPWYLDDDPSGPKPVNHFLKVLGTLTKVKDFTPLYEYKSFPPFLTVTVDNFYVLGIGNFLENTPGDGKALDEIILSVRNVEKDAPQLALLQLDSEDYIAWAQNETVSGASVADINNDHDLDILVASRDHGLTAYRGKDGDLVWQSSGSNSTPTGLQGVSLADIDGNSTLEAVSLSFCPGCASKVLAYTFPASHVDAYTAPWAMHRHDLHRTAWYEYPDPSAYPAKLTTSPVFVRGDANSDGEIDIADPIYALFYMFANPDKKIQPQCLDALDSDDNGKLEVTDAVFTLQYLFGNGPAPSLPFPSLGPDPTDDNLTCDISQ